MLGGVAGHVGDEDDKIGEEVCEEDDRYLGMEFRSFASKYGPLKNIQYGPGPFKAVCGTLINPSVPPPLRRLPHRTP